MVAMATSVGSLLREVPKWVAPAFEPYVARIFFESCTTTTLELKK